MVRLGKRRRTIETLRTLNRVSGSSPRAIMAAARASWSDARTRMEIVRDLSTIMCPRETPVPQTAGFRAYSFQNESLQPTLEGAPPSAAAASRVRDGPRSARGGPGQPVRRRPGVDEPVHLPG